MPCKCVFLLFQLASMDTERCYISVGVLSGQIYACGGCCVNSNQQRLKTVEIFDVVNNVWLPCASMNQSRSDAGMETLDGKEHYITAFLENTCKMFHMIIMIPEAEFVDN